MIFNSEFRKKLISIYTIFLLLLLIFINSFQIDNIKNSHERSEYVGPVIIAPLREPGNLTRSSDDFEKYNWQYTVIDNHSTIFGDISLAFDSNDNPHLLYITDTTCYYSYLDGVSWITETLTSGDYFYPQCIIVLDKDDHPHICIDSEQLNLTYGYHNGMAWHFEVLETNYSSSPDLAVDSNGHPHIVYRGSGANLYHQYHNGTAWNKTIFNEVKDCYGASIKIDSNDLPHISCSNRGKNTTDELKYFYFEGTDWQNVTVPDAPSFTTTTLELDSNDQPHIFYLVSWEHSIQYVYNNGKKWINSFVGTFDSIVFSFQLSSDGRLYYSNRNRDNKLRLFRYNGTVWQFIGTGTTGYISSTTFFKLDSNNNPHIAYLSSHDNYTYLNYATKFDELVQPVANAGKDLTIDQYDSVVLDGSASYDNIGISNYSWLIPQKPHYIRTFFGKKLKYTFEDYGTFIIKLKVIDYSCNWDTDDVTIMVTVNDLTPPTADAGVNITVDSGTMVTFNGSRSFDNIEIINYSWLFEYDNFDYKLYGEVTQFKFHVIDIYEIILLVKDQNGNFNSDSINVTVNYGEFPKALLLFPQNNASLPGPNITLQWTTVNPNDDDKIIYDIYFGTSKDPPLFKPGIFENILNITVVNRATYFWKVQASVGTHRGAMSPTWNFSVEYGIPEFDLDISTKYLNWQIMQGSSGKFSVTVENEGSHSDWILININVSDLPDTIFFEISENEFNLNPNKSIDIFFNIQTNNTTPVGHYFLTITAISKGALKYEINVEKSIQINLTITTLQSKDQDGDNLLDSWEIKWFDNIEKYDGKDDPDGDGKTNLYEFKNDTNPLKANVKTKEDASLMIVIIILLIIIITIFLILIILNRGKGRDGENNYHANYKY